MQKLIRLEVSKHAAFQNKHGWTNRANHYGSYYGTPIGSHTLPVKRNHWRAAPMTKVHNIVSVIY